MSSSDIKRRCAIGVAAGGLLIGAGGAAHPRVDTSLELEQGLAGMFASSAWTAAHLLTGIGFAVLAISLAALVRARGAGWSRGLRISGSLAAIAAGFAAVESVPHLLAASELDALRAGEPTPLTDLHTVLQAISTPFTGLSFAVLAVAGARGLALHGGRVVVALAVAGGLAFALAGPAVALTGDAELSPLFAGSAGLAVWAVVAGVATARRSGDRGARRLTPAAGGAA